ncbi:hypothetical protein EON65_22420 [archaeon]|nr:MAG: hypothetical protein EON65_22420 [archaeon]
MQKAHGLKRMQDGLRALLSLHHPVELSSICGCLKLKVQQKVNVSMNQIIKYASEKEEIDVLKIKTILRFMYEGALWEYLHSIGEIFLNSFFPSFPANYSLF